MHRNPSNNYLTLINAAIIWNWLSYFTSCLRETLKHHVFNCALDSAICPEKIFYLGCRRMKATEYFNLKKNDHLLIKGS